MLKRYVHGIGSDDPLVSYDGSGSTNPTYLLADERRSIMAETNSTGNDPMNAVDPDGKSLKLIKATFNVVKRMLKGDSGKDAIKGEAADFVDNVRTLTDGEFGIDDAIAVVDLATGFGKEAGNLVDATKGAGKATTIADGAASEDGFVFPH